MRRVTIGTLLLLCVSAQAVAQESREATDKAKIAEAARQAEQAWQDKNWEGAVTGYRAVVKLDPKNATAWHHLGYALHTLGRLDEALEAHLKAGELRQTRPVGLYNAGCVYALKKDKDKAFEFLMKAAESGFGQVDQLDADEDLASLHDDPRWAKLVEAVKSAEDGGGGIQAFTNPGERKASRVAWFGPKGSPGQVALSYGAVDWKTEYDKLVAAPKFQDKRWRLGKDFWTTLDTNIPVKAGDKTVPPGLYYLTLEHKANGDYVLALNDSNEVRKLKLDAFQAGQTKGGIEIPMKHETLASPAGKLDIALSVEPDDNTKGVLTIQFGPHKLTLPLAYELAIAK